MALTISFVQYSHVSFVFNAKFPITVSAQICYPDRIFIHFENVVNILTLLNMPVIYYVVLKTFRVDMLVFIIYLNVMLAN